MTEIVAIWRDSLHTILDRYERKKISTGLFFPLLFIFFVVLNIACYWWAIYTAFPYYMQTHEASHYIKLQIPVGFFGALFDSLSFFITIWIIKRALAARKTSEYVFHLSLDLIIAVVATFGCFLFSPLEAGLSVSGKTHPKNLLHAEPNIPTGQSKRYKTPWAEKTPRIYTLE
jgi:uncharacterized protein with PQ loop repeat